MKHLIFIFVFLMPLCLTTAQQISCSPENRTLVEAKIKEVNGLLQSDLGATVAQVGKTFLSVPYVAKTLEIGETETLVVNLQGLDCTTFVENAMAFGLMLHRGQTQFGDFTETLEQLRYLDGKMDGYGSRLHYFTHWIRNNEKKGLLKDMTAALGGVGMEKDINFMGTHRELYPFLKDDDNFEQILATEKGLAKEDFCYLPQDQIAANEHLIKTGDIIALATSIKGLDVTHTGFAVREANGRIHLLHASTTSMEVEVTKEPLAEYLKGVSKNIGVLVARPMVPEK
ncbi:N-acetylmuramoyl-L-alanine amidase-like domain-containing protein [Maribacter sp. 2307ULW6-5]|uniref:N-acetylmuramoyl-L-alanine amidase-like domain-containing protein n=1 Tax=Maribacter sp. 2307ULW6-5 TaxID=3386275 RepID=UPI0039BC8BF8